MFYAIEKDPVYSIVDIMQTMSWDHNAIKLKISNNKRGKEISICWKPTNNKQRQNTHKNGSPNICVRGIIICQNSSGTAKPVFRGEIIVLNTFI